MAMEEGGSHSNGIENKIIEENFPNLEKEYKRPAEQQTDRTKKEILHNML